MLTSDLAFFAAKFYLLNFKKECNSSKLLDVFFRIHILFCAISLNSEWPSNARAFVDHSLVS